MDTSRVTRFEVIDHSRLTDDVGRVLTRFGVRASVSLQDDDRTMKVFLTARDPQTTAEEAAVVVVESGEGFDLTDVGYTLLGEYARSVAVADDQDDETVLAKIRDARANGLSWYQLGLGLPIAMAPTTGLDVTPS